MSRADELRRQADLVQQMEVIAAQHDAALERYRADRSDENKAAYREATARLQEARAADRADRTGLGIVAGAE